MHEFKIERNHYLNQTIQAFYNLDYVGFREPGNPDYINTLKNTFARESRAILVAAAKKLVQVITPDLQQISDMNNVPLTLCVIPRAKAARKYTANQWGFTSMVQDVGQELGYVDGTEYIIRHTDTKTTHLARSKIANEGSMPYPGITEETCTLSPLIRDKSILLVDDIYTKSVNIDEDAIQALLNNGARSVIFYAVARTVFHGERGRRFVPTDSERHFSV
jgi:predicted amidophosphoribosyltransferase